LIDGLNRCQLGVSLERNNELRRLVERRLRGDVASPRRRDDVCRLEQLQSELGRLVTENQALRSQQAAMEHQLDAARQKYTRSMT